VKDLQLTRDEIEAGLSGERGPWGTLVAHGPQRYQITDLDVLWGCRMVVGERGDEALEVLQTMAQRFFLLGLWDSLADLFLRYSQPINPRHRRGAPGVVEGRPYYERHRLDRRAFLARASLDELRTAPSEPMGAAGVTMALGWFRGQLTTDKVPGAVHFAIPSLVTKDHLGGDRDNPLCVHKAGNWFAAVRSTRGWAADAVRVLPPGGAIPDPQPEPIPDPGLRPEAIRELQRRLAAAGADPGPIDGIWGRKSQAALDRWRALDREIEAAAAAASLDGGV
jgi:hypothetical protein